MKIDALGQMDALGQLESWLSEAGGHLRGCRLGENAVGARGLFVEHTRPSGARGLHAGEVVLSVPAKLILTAGQAAGRGFPDSSEADLCALVLHAERRLGVASAWAAWMPTLPNEDLPMLWSEAEVDALACPVLVARAHAQRADALERLAALREAPHPMAPPLQARSPRSSCGDANEETGELFLLEPLEKHNYGARSPASAPPARICVHCARVCQPHYPTQPICRPVLV